MLLTPILEIKKAMFKKEHRHKDEVVTMDDILYLCLLFQLELDILTMYIHQR
jgi:hypothetical protein